jgi:primase-polymerase (primpol)-like protein
MKIIIYIININAEIGRFKEEPLHIIVKGKIPGSRRRKGNIEMYDSGRFFTMTGKSIGKYKGLTSV